MSALLERWFGLKQQQSNPRTEVLANYPIALAPGMGAIFVARYVFL